MNEYTATNKWNRSMVKKPNRRYKCSCGCNGRETHMGLGDGVGMMVGCELYVRRWVRDGSVVFKNNLMGDV